jgi:hypothetical protein
MGATINYPFGNATAETLAAGGTIAITISDQLTFIDGLTTKQTTARTLNLTISDTVRAGAMIFLKWECNTATAGNRNFIFGTGFNAETCPTLQPPTAKECAKAFIYNGTEFDAMAAHVEEA